MKLSNRILVASPLIGATLGLILATSQLLSSDNRNSMGSGTTSLGSENFSTYEDSQNISVSTYLQSILFTFKHHVLVGEYDKAKDILFSVKSEAYRHSIIRNLAIEIQRELRPNPFIAINSDTSSNLETEINSAGFLFDILRGEETSPTKSSYLEAIKSVIDLLSATNQVNSVNEGIELLERKLRSASTSIEIEYSADQIESNSNTPNLFNTIAGQVTLVTILMTAIGWIIKGMFGPYLDELGARMKATLNRENNKAE